jgi:hypothetical protein
MGDPRLGAKVTFSRTLRRVWFPPASGPSSKATKRWVSTRTPVKAGIVIGLRTLANGTVQGGYDEPIEFHATEHVTAYLIVFDIRRKPVLVPPVHVEWDDE